ncbi:MAG TPA: formimidoylglutamate deiminase [Burkholderiales bacterium]|jgi:formimidoylglutamate deiminase|nr:formimidoylglutamate deiminase [Burkholderiales bacterium]
MTSRLFAPHALLRDGWADDVVLEIDADGTIIAATPRAPAHGAERLAGPVIPGMPDLHSHAFQRAMAGRAERRGASGRDSFWTWRDTMYRFVARLGPDDVHAVASQLHVELLKSGYTSVAEFQYVHNAPDGSAYADPAEMSLAHVRAAGESGIALTVLPTLYAHGGFGGAPLGAAQARFATSPDGLLRVVQRARDVAGADTRVGAAAHSLRAVNPPELQALVDGITCLDPAAPIHVHAAEQAKEVEDCVAWSGQRPVAWLLDHAPVDARWCLVHCTHLDDAELPRLAASGAVAGLCPSTEANLGDGMFRLSDYLAAAGRFGIGSDSQVLRDPAEELRWLEYGQRLARLERSVAASAMQPSVGATLWDAAARGGAQALGRAAGALAPGRVADLLVLEAGHVDLAGRRGDDLLDALLFSGSGGLVRDVMVGGRWVVREGRHAAEDAIAARYRATVARLLA